MSKSSKKFSKKLAFGVVSTVVVASSIVPTVASAKSFSDVPSTDSHFPGISALSDMGIITGYPDGTFKPSKTLSRSDVVKMFGKYLVSEGYSIPSDYKTNIRFKDLNAQSDDELLKYAALVYDQGVFKGNNGNLMPLNNMTRENMALVIVRAFNSLLGTDLIAEYEKSGTSSSIKDLSKARAETKPYIQALEYYGVTVVENYRPTETTTRGQFASFLYRAIQNIIGESGAIDTSSIEFTSDGKTISGQIIGGKPGTTITLYDDQGNVLGTTTLKENGIFTFKLEKAISPGDIIIIEAGSAITTISVPNLVELIKITGSTLTFSSDGKFVTGKVDAKYAGKTVTVKNGSTTIGSGKIGTDGSFTITLSPAVKKGDQLTFIMSNAEGNNLVSDPIEVPDIASSNVLLKDSVSFATSGNKVSGRVNNPFTGSVVTASVNNVTIGTGAVAADGTYSFELSPTVKEKDQVTLSIKDTTGTKGQDVTVTVPDITAPKAVTQSDLTFNTAGTIMTGTTDASEAGGTVVVKNAAGTTIGTSIISTTGKYSVSLYPAVVTGDKFTVTLTDTSGHSSTSQLLTVPTLDTIKAVNDITTTSFKAVEEGTLSDLSGTQFSVAHIGLDNVAGVDVVDIEGAIDLVIPENTVYDLTASVTSNTVLGGSSVVLNVYKKDANGVFKEYYTSETAAGGLLGIPLGGEGYQLTNLTEGEYTFFLTPGVGLGVLSNFTTTLSNIKTYHYIDSQTTTPITGNVLTNDEKGIKNTKVSKVGNTLVTSTGSTATTTYGVVTMKADGSYTYKANGNFKSIGKIDKIPYTIQNDDGQTSQATLLVRIDSPDVSINWGSSTNENSPTLMTAVNDSANASMSRNGTATKSIANDFDKGFTIQDRESVVSFTSYTLNGNTIEIHDANGTIVKTVEVPGSAGVQQLSFTDLPAGYYTVTFAKDTYFDNYGIKETYQVWNTTSATGNILSNDSTGSIYTRINVQSPLTNAMVGVGTNTTLAGKYGTLVISGDGKFTYTPNSTVDVVNKVEVFNYQLVYPNGETVNAILQINIGGTSALSFNVDGSTATNATETLAYNLSNANNSVATIAEINPLS